MNIVTATFSAGCTQIEADRKLWQYDQGQILQIVGLDLPDAYQVEFSNSRDKGSAKPQIGGPDGVSIPDEYLTTGEPVYAFLVGHTGETDRETEKLVVIYVKARSQPTDEPITPEQQTIVDQLIAALTAGVAKAEDAAAQAETAISYMPKIVDGTWWVYDAETETWADTGIQAEGRDGVGISDAVLNANYTLTLTFTDGSSYTTPSIRGPKGEDAPTDYILVQPTEPTSPTNRLWVDSDRGSTVQLPTMADHQTLVEAVAANTQGLATQKSAIEDLQDLTNRKAGMLVDTVSGAVASFVPDSTIDNLLGVSVDIEPVQDLHGYDAPWPGGGGKNLLDAGTVFAAFDNGDGTYTGGQGVSGITSVLIPLGAYIGQTLTMSMTVSGKTGATNVWYIRGTINGVSNGGNDHNRVLAADTLPKRIYQSFTPETENDVVAISYGSGAGTLTIKDIQLEIGSAMTSYAPYSNECPISGWDSVGIPVTGVNVWDEEWEVGGINPSTGGNWNTNTRIRSKNYIPIKPSTEIYISYPTSGVSVDYCFYDANKSLVASGNSANRAITTPQNAMYMRFATYAQYGTTYNHDISINYPATDHDYHPYAGNSYIIQLGQTVYGGTLDATAGTMTVDMAAVDLGTLTWTKNESSLIGLPCFTATLPGVKPGAPYFNCSEYAIKRDRDAINGTAQISPGNGSNATYCVVRDDRYADSTAADFKTAVSGITLVYPLASPVVIQLDPVTISTISGQTNNVWADAGDVDVTFAADVKTYIDNKIAAAVAAMS